MSRKVAALVYSRTVGSMAKKAVLAYFAERANDDGSGIWCSKQSVADEIECSKQTVISVVKDLIDKGLLREVGKRPLRNRPGHTVVYDIDLSVVARLPTAKASDQEIQISHRGPNLDPCPDSTASQGSSGLTHSGQPPLPKPSLNRPSQKTSSSSRGTRAKPRGPIPDDFDPPALTKFAGEIEAKWAPGRRARELEAFDAYHRREATLAADWPATWRTWVLNSKKWDDRDGIIREDGKAGGGGSDGFLKACRAAGNGGLGKVVDAGFAFIMDGNA